MKKTALIISLFIVANSVFAQFTIGPKVGLNISKEYSGVKLTDEGLDFRTGLNLGVFGRYEIGNGFDIQAELLYSQQGSKYNVPIVDVLGTPVDRSGFKTLTHYLNIPLLLKYYPISCLYIEAGPQVGFCIDKSESLFGSIDDKYKTIDFSLAGGIGYNIGSGLSVNARYNYGFTQVIPDLKLKSRVIQISLAYDLWSF